MLRLRRVRLSLSVTPCASVRLRRVRLSLSVTVRVHPRESGSTALLKKRIVAVFFQSAVASSGGVTLGVTPNRRRGRLIGGLSSKLATHRHAVTETPADISAAPLRYRHIPLTGAPASAHGRAACHPIARVCVPLDAAVTRVTCTCPARRGPARRGCHSCDACLVGSPRVYALVRLVVSVRVVCISSGHA